MFQCLRIVQLNGKNYWLSLLLHSHLLKPKGKNICLAPKRYPSQVCYDSSTPPFVCRSEMINNSNLSKCSKKISSFCYRCIVLLNCAIFAGNYDCFVQWTKGRMNNFDSLTLKTKINKGLGWGFWEMIKNTLYVQPLESQSKILPCFPICVSVAAK